VFALNLPHPSELDQMKHTKLVFFHLRFSMYMFKDSLLMAHLFLSPSDDLKVPVSFPHKTKLWIAANRLWGNKKKILILWYS